MKDFKFNGHKEGDLLKIPDRVALNSAKELIKSLDDQLAKSRELSSRLQVNIEKSNRKYNILKAAMEENLQPNTIHAIMKSYNRKLNEHNNQK